jgi:hypothetical protein
MSPAARPALDHLIALTDDVGLLQHARRNIPNRAHGYCLDDVGRALIVACDAAAEPRSAFLGRRLLAIYLAYVVDAQRHDGRFHNFMGYDRRWQDHHGSEDSFGRACWGLGYTATHAPDAGMRAVARDLLTAALPHVDALPHLRSRAYAALGLVHVAAAERRAGAASAALRAAVTPIVDAYRTTAAPGWEWCEDVLTYDNARLCEALLRAGSLLEEPELVAAGRAMLDFYAGVTLEDGIFVPIGNDGWYARGGTRARYAQQPLEAAALVDAAAIALAITGDERYGTLVRAGATWYFGRNTRGATLVESGGCRDGIGEREINENMGAESTLAYLMSAYTAGRVASISERRTLLHATGL